MEHESRKREREEKDEDCKENPKKLEFLSGIEDGDIFKFSDSFRPLGVFEFPWEKDENLESDEWKSHDVFYSSLVESSLVEFPTDEGLPEQIALDGGKLEDESWPSEEEDTNGVDCIWSCVLNQPLSFGANKVSSA